MSVTFTLTFTLPVAERDFTRLACVSLQAARWRVESAQEHYRHIVASKKFSEKHGRDFFNYDFSADVDWSQDGSGVAGKIVITDNNTMGNAQNCEQRSWELFHKMQEMAQRAHTSQQNRKPPTTYGSARWATEQELYNKGYVVDAPSAKRLLIAPMGQKFLAVPELETAHHAIVCGPQGAGKSTGFFVPNILSRIGTSMIVTEATPGMEDVPDLYLRTAGARREAGHKIYTFNPTDMASTRINPIDRVRLAPHTRTEQEAEALAELLISNSVRSGQRVDPIWDNAERHMLFTLILHAAAGPAKCAHFGMVRTMLMKGPNYLRKMLKDSPCKTAEAEYAAIKLNSSENFLFGVTSGLMQKLTPWLTQQIVTLTCKTDIQPDELKNELFTFYLSVPARRQDLKALISLIFNYLLNTALETRFTYPLALMLDEFTNFGHIPGFSDTLTVIRKTGIGAVLGFQDYMQLQKVYGNTDAAIIFSQPGTRVFFRPRAFHTAKEISTALGPTTIEHIRITDTGRTDTREIGRPLMTPGELMSLEDHEVIIFTPSTAPLRHQKFTPEAFSWGSQSPLPNRFQHPIDNEAMQCGKEIQSEPFEKQRKQQGQRDFDRNKWREGQSRPPKKKKPQNRQQGYKQQRPREDEHAPVDYEEDRPQKPKSKDRQVPDSDL